jgi:HTH-type transcriptional regulator / antitoxin HigA
MERQLTVIKSESQYREYLAELQEIMTRPEQTPDAVARVELLSLLVETYEKEHFPLPAPTPVEAIQFRLEQLGLKQTDLIPLIGSKGRVSEIISGKRRLTLPMIRRLSSQLGIPSKVLIGDPSVELDEESTNALKPLAKELVRRGWMQSEEVYATTPEEFVAALWKKLGVRELDHIYFKRSFNLGASTPIDLASVQVWIARVIVKSRESKVRAKYDKRLLTDEILTELPRLSWFEDGPVLAKQYLEKLGVTIVIEDHLPGTGIDGASTLDADGAPIIALTLRHDRLDNFWFTLMHECVHVIKHLQDPGDIFVDDVEDQAEHDAKETEANRIARDSLIPPIAWRSSTAPKLKTAEAVRTLATKLRISPSIVAGRIRRESGNYRILSSMVGYRCVSKAFGLSKE